MTRSKKIFLGFGLLLLWGLGVWVTFRPATPTAEEKFGEWLATRRHAAPVGRLEVWANRFRIDYFSKARREKDLRLTKELLADGDYSVAVASWLDSERRIAPGVSATWPHLQRSLEEMMGSADPVRLDAALSRADEARFATWDRTIARSAYRSGAQEELAPIVKALRDFEQVHRSGSRRMESLQRLSGLYSLSPADFARALAEEEDPAMEALLDLVMQDLGFSRSGAYEAVLSEWKSGGIPEADMGLLERILGNAKLGLFRNEVFIWLALGRESEEWRTRHRAKLGELLEEFHRSEPDFARSVASDLVDELIKRSDQLTADWKLVTGILLSKIDPEPDLKVWISDTSAPNFMWLCHQVDAEGLLNRSVRVWNDSVQNRSAWIGEFIDAEHFGAACALIEGAKEDVVYIRSKKETYAEEKAKKLDDYRALGEQIGEHSKEPQVKGFIRLDLGITAMRNLHRTPEEEAAKSEVFEAIKILNEAETFNPHLLERTVALMMELEEDFFAAGRPSFDKWRGVETPELVLDRVIHGDWQEDARGFEIWRKYFTTFLRISEIPSLEDTVERLIRSALDDERSQRELHQLEDFLKVGSDSSQPTGTNLGVWVIKKMIGGRRWEEAAQWMFDRIEDFHAQNPDSDLVTLVHRMHEDLERDLDENSVADCLFWLGAVLTDERSQRFPWPETFQVVYRHPEVDPGEVIGFYDECLGTHPLRRWIVRDLMAQSFPKTVNGPDRRLEFLELAEAPWVKEVINEYLDGTFDLDAFAKDFETASPGARRFFLKNPVVPGIKNRPPRHPTNRDFSKEEISRVLIWEARQAIEIAERREVFESHAFVRLFTDLIAEAETRPDDPVIRPLFERLQRINFEPPWHRFRDFEFKSLRELQARALPYSKGISETQNLLTNVALPATERVWKLALKGELETARTLMKARADELDYGIPKGMKRSDLASPALAKFHEAFPEGDELGIYVSIYLSGLRDHLPVYGSLSYVNIRWPYSPSHITKYEDDLRELVQRFEVAVFSNKKLERQTTVLLGGLYGAPALMPEKLTSLRESATSDYHREILPLLEFDASLTEGGCNDIRRHLSELSESGEWESSGRPVHAFEVLEYHLWRRALLGLEITEEQREAIQELCFSTRPFRELAPSGENVSGFHRMVREQSRMYPLHLALDMIERVPNRPGAWTWTDFEGLDLSPYRDSKGFHANLFGGAIAVLARQCRDWSEEDRWSLIGVFEEPLPGISERPQVVRGLAMFQAGGFVEEEEVVRRSRDFVTRYPASGWNYYTVWRLGQDYGDESLAAFGRAGAEPYLAEDPKLRKAFDTRASKTPAP